MLNRRTLVALARLTEGTRSSANIDVLAYEFNCESAAVGSNKLQRSLNIVRAIEARATEANDIRPMLEFVEAVFRDVNDWAHQNNPDVESFISLLEVDGYQFTNGHLIPTTPGPAALGAEVSALEAQLNDAGLNVASTHYRQACDNFADRNWESANGQIRSFLENLFLAMSDRLTGKQFHDAGAALQHLNNEGILEPAEWNTWRGFWATCQTNGPHHGLSNDREAIYRLQIATAVGRYALEIIART